MMTFMFAGHDTTMNQMTWLFYYISQNSDVEARFHAELDQVLAGRTPTFQDLSQLTFLDKVLFCGLSFTSFIFIIFILCYLFN